MQNKKKSLKLQNNYKFSFDGSTTASAASSDHPHRYTSLGKLSSGLVAISGRYAANEVELFSAHAWSRQADFPESDYFYGYSTATVADELYIFGEDQNSYFPSILPVLTNLLGGVYRDEQSVTVGRMRNSKLEWTSAPDLLLARHAHRSIALGHNILHIGGEGKM